MCFMRFKVTNTLYSKHCTLLLLLYAPPFLNAQIFIKLIVLLRPSLYCDALSWRDDTKTIKPIINEAFVASSGDIITDYNDIYCLFTHRVASRCVNITMSAFVIGETINNKHYSTPLKTRVWIVSSRNVLTGCESEAPDCSCKVGIAHFIETAFDQARIVGLLFQVQETVLHKMRCTHSNIWVELFWNSVVNTTVPLISSHVLFWKPKLSTFTFMKHSVSRTWCRRQQ